MSPDSSTMSRPISLEPVETMSQKRLVEGGLNKLELESLDFDICGRIGIKQNDTSRPLRVIRVKNN